MIGILLRNDDLTNVVVTPTAGNPALRDGSIDDSVSSDTVLPESSYGSRVNHVEEEALNSSDVHLWKLATMQHEL